MKRFRRRSSIGYLVGIALAVAGCGGGSGDGAGTTAAAPSLVAVFTAFPAELAPLVAQTQVDHTVELNGRTFRVGTLAGVPVVLGMTGIGLVNAGATSAAVLDAFAVDGVVVAGVAGSPLRIGDVAVPAAWRLRDASTFDVAAEWLALARRIARQGAIAFDQCTEVPSQPDRQVCVAHEPVIAVGGVGESDDTAGPTAMSCFPGAGDVFGCDVTDQPRASAIRSGAVGAEEEPTAVDEETAAIAREAAARGIPFIAFRAVSDGADDPLNLPGFPAQFFTYYRLAARNAAAAATAFLARLR